MSDNLVVVKIKTLGRGRNELETSVPSDISITDLKQRLFELTEVPADRQRVIYLGKVLKDDQKLSDYNFKAGGTLHMVGSPNGPQVSSNPAPSVQPNPVPPRTSTTNVVMGVIPSGSAPPNIEQLLSNVLNSVGLGSAQPVQNDNNNNNNNNNPSPPGSFQNLRNIVQSLETQINNVTNDNVQQSPSAIGNSSVEELGQIIRRISDGINRLQPSLNQLGVSMSNESSIQSVDERNSIQERIRNIRPAVQQMSTALAILNTSLNSVNMGTNPSESVANDTSSNIHRNFIGERGNVSVHVANVGNSEGGNLDVNNLVQNIVGSIRQRNQGQQGGEASNSPINNNPNSSGQPSSSNTPISNQPPPSMNSQPPPNSNQSTNNNAQANMPNIANFFSQISSLATSNADQNSRNNASNTIGNMINSLLPLIGGSGGFDRSIASATGFENEVEDGDEMGKIILLFFQNITLNNLLEFRDGNWSSIENLQEKIRVELRNLMGNQSIDEYASFISQSTLPFLEENQLPQEILNKKKPNTNLSNICINIFEKQTKILIRGIFKDFTPSDDNRFPFSTFIKQWTYCTIGYLITDLSSALEGGVNDSKILVRHFIAERLNLVNSAMGPMISIMLDPLVSTIYTRYLEIEDQFRADILDLESDNNSISHRELSEDEINKIIELDVEIQNKMKSQPPFSDAYIQGIPIMQRPQNRISNSELRNANLLLCNNFNNAVSDSGISNGNNSDNYQSVVSDNETLTNLYVNEILNQCRERIRNDEDFSSSKYPNSSHLLD